MDWVSLGANVGSSLLGSLGGSSAKRKMEEAAAASAKLKGDMYQQGRQDQMPFYTAGTDALSQLTQRLPELTASYDPSRLLSEPGYEFGRTEGLRGLEQSLAARGMTNSGAAMKRAMRYGNDYATTKLGEAFNRDRMSRMDALGALQGLAGMGQRTGENFSREGNAYAGSVSSDIWGAANAGAANDVAQGGIWGNLLGSTGSLIKDGLKTGGGFGMPTTSKRIADPEDYGQFLADGGPVRVEPKVGTKAPPRRGGTGGGMSREAVLNALDVAWRDVPATPQPAAPGALDPFRKGVIPRVEMALNKADGYAKGGAVRSKTGGKADKVKANLSGGEHVFDAEIVAMLGDGNTEAGHAMLEELKQRVRQFKRKAPPGKPAPALEVEVE